MGKDAPEAPDPYAVADAQTKSNIRSAQEQARLAMTGQETPGYSVQYVTDPTSPSGYRAITELSPEMQALYGQGQDLQAQYGGIAGAQLGRVGDVMATPFDLSAARGTEISDIQRTFLDPQWGHAEEALKTDLFNRGIRPGSEEYQREMAMFSDNRSKAYDRMFLDAYNTGNASALTQRGLPMAELAALRGGYMPILPGFPEARTPAPNVAATNIGDMVYKGYEDQLNAYTSQMGGLFGLGGSVLGGWARSPSGSAAITGALGSLLPFSDRRVKTEIRKIADDPRGWGVYLFKYIVDKLKGEAPWQLGYMADEVQKVRPDAVVTDPQFGTLRVNYSALAT